MPDLTNVESIHFISPLLSLVTKANEYLLNTSEMASISNSIEKVWVKIYKSYLNFTTNLYSFLTGLGSLSQFFPPLLTFLYFATHKVYRDTIKDDFRF